MGKLELRLGISLGVTGLMTACVGSVINEDGYVLAEEEEARPAQITEIAESAGDIFSMIPNPRHEIVYFDFGESDPSEVNEETLYEIADQTLESTFPGFDIQTYIPANIGSLPFSTEFPPAPVAALPFAESFMVREREQRMYNPKSLGLGRATPHHTEQMHLQAPPTTHQPLTNRMQ